MPATERKSSRTDSMMVAVGAVIIDHDHRVLIVKHVEAKKDGYWYGKWICPGGKLRFGESLEDGTKREVLEETGLEIELLGKPIVFDRIVKRLEDTQLHVIYIDHQARVVSGYLQTGSDVGVAEWFSEEQLKLHWEELHEDTKRLLMGLNIIGKDVTTLVA